MGKKKIFISTSIPFVNAPPHIGHALEFVQADTLARYYRLLNHDVFFLSGTDENAQKNVRAAEKKGLSPQKLIKKYSERFRQFKTILNISFDDFIRTTEERHKKGSQNFWQLCQKDIYKKSYRGWYCLGCEAFVTKKDLVNGKCPEHQKEPEFVEEENYFFTLKKYQKKIKEVIVNDKIKIRPKERKNEILSFIDQGLEDFSISRDAKRLRNWGIPVPNDPTQIIYVWFDALINYITGLNFSGDQKLYKKFWESDSKKIHVIGKGIIRFHAIYWPAMLLSAKIPLPSHEFIHGYITINGEKISKSLGNVIDPFEVVKKYGTDATRYYLLKEIHPFKDGDFTYKRFEEVYNSDLANGLGNLVQRVAKLCEKVKLDGSKFKPKKSDLNTTIANYFEKFKFNQALEIIWKYISALDKYIERKRPWEKSGQELKEILGNIITGVESGQSLLEIAHSLKPFLPETARKIEDIFTAQRIKAPAKPLFPRI